MNLRVRETPYKLNRKQKDDIKTVMNTQGVSVWTWIRCVRTGSILGSCKHSIQQSSFIKGGVYHEHRYNGVLWTIFQLNAGVKLQKKAAWELNQTLTHFNVWVSHSDVYGIWHDWDWHTGQRIGIVHNSTQSSKLHTRWHSYDLKIFLCRTPLWWRILRPSMILEILKNVLSFFPSSINNQQQKSRHLSRYSD